MLKKLLINLSAIALFLGGLLCFNAALGQTVTFAPETTNLNTGNLTGYVNNYAVYGFSITVTGTTETIGTVNIKDALNNNLTNFFTNGRLYRTSTPGYNSSSPGTQVGTVTFGTGLITISGMNESFSVGQQKYYYLVVDCIATSSGAFQPNIGYGQSPVGIISSTGTQYNNNSNGYENYYNFVAGTPPSMSLLTSGVTSNSTSLVPSQSGVVVFGFSITTAGNFTFNQFQINSNSASLNSYISSAVLYNNTTNDYATGSKTAVGTAAVGSSYITVTGSESVNLTTKYYFLVVTTTSSFSTVPANIQFNFTSGQTSAALTQNSPSRTFNNFTISGNAYNFNSASLSMSSLTSGLSTTTVYPGQVNVAVMGFSLAATTGSATISGVNINSDNSNLSTYYNNFKLYSNTTNDYSTGTKTLIGTTSSASGSFINFSSLTLNQTINSTPKYYFLVADVSYAGTGTNSTTFKFISGQSTNALIQISPTSSYNTFNVSGNAYNITQATFTTNNSVSGLVSGNLVYGNTNQAIYGFSINATGITSLQGFVLGDLGGITTSSTFTNAKLYRGTSSAFNAADLGSYTLLATGVPSGTNITFSGFSDQISNTTQYYFMVVDDIYFSSSGHTQLRMNSLTMSSGTSNPGVYGVYYNFSLPVVTVTGYNDVTNGITPGTLSYGQTNIVLFGFSLQVSGGLNVSQFNFSASGFPSSVPNAYFSNARLYRSTTNVFPSGAPLYTSANVSIGSSVFSASVSETIVNTTYYYWLVADYTVITGGQLSSFLVGFNAGGAVQSPAAVVVTSPNAITYNSYYINGKTFNVVNTVDWTGAVSNDLSNAGNYLTLSGGAVGAAPTGAGSVQNITIGKRTATSGRYPIITTGTELGKITFDPTAAASPTLTINSGVTLQLNGGLVIKDGSTPTITGGTLNLPSGSASFINPTSILTLGANTIISNSGSFTLRSSASGTASVANIPSTSRLDGTYIVERYFTGGALSNRGWRLMSFPVNTTSTRPVTSAATSDFTSLKTNLLITGAGGSANGWDQPSGYTANGPTILFYNNAGTGSFTIPTTFASTTSGAGQGFYFYFRGNNSSPLSKLVRSGPNFATPEAGVVGLQTGTLNQQNFTKTLSYTGTTGYNLVGNPYPSSITIASSGVLTGTTGFVYTFTPGGNSITSNSTPVTIGSGQGFFVKSNNVTSSIAFSESMKTASQPLTLLMGIPVADPVEGSVKLQMVQDSANYDVAQLRFSNNYTPNYVDTEDADDLNGNGQTVFFGAMTADKRLVGIASQPLDTKKTSVFLSVNDNSSGIFSIKKEDISNIPERYDVWLMDHFKKDSLDLRANSTYNFNLDKSNPLTFGDSRFEVVIRIKDLPKYQLTSFNGTRSQGANILQWNVQNEYTYTYFELERSFDNKTFEGVNNSMSTASGNYTFTDRGATNSLIFYRLKQTDIYGNTYTSIVIIQAEDGDNKVFSVYPNPVSDFLKFDIKEDVKGTITMSIYNSVGRMVKSSSHSSTTGQENVSSLLPGPYTVELIDNGTKKRLASTKFIKQ